MNNQDIINKVTIGSVQDWLYKHLKNDKGNVNPLLFERQLKDLGLLKDDPRIQDIMEILEVQHTDMNEETFLNCVKNNLGVIQHFYTEDCCIKKWSNFGQEILKDYQSCKNMTGGAKASYIPQLAMQNEKHWGVSICSADGQRMDFGNTNVQFCVQSMCKAINYCIALEEHGIEFVHKHVQVEPSGRQFNAIELTPKLLPHNPLINAGAIMTTSLIQIGKPATERFSYIKSVWKDLAGGKEIGFDMSIYLSEKDSAWVNNALANLMMGKGAFHKGISEQKHIQETLELYFQCCSLLVTSDTMAVVAGTLANGGCCPLTGKQVLKQETVKSCLSVMASCGMYDYSGQFAFDIGLPAKSGVAGGVFVVVPNALGITTFSPNLDEYGNSVRGVEFCKKLVSKFNFHGFDSIVNVGDKIDPRKEHDKEEHHYEQIIKYASLDDHSALKRLQLRQIDLNFGDYDNRTPLHLAASNGHINTVKYLVELGGVKDINVLDRWGNTPYDDTIREGHKKVSDYLKSKGGKIGKDIRKDVKPTPNPVPTMKQKTTENEKMTISKILFSQLLY